MTRKSSALVLGTSLVVAAVLSSSSSAQYSTPSGSYGSQGAQTTPPPSTPQGMPPTSPGPQGQQGSTGQTQPLSAVPNAEQKLASASVRDSSGQPIGKVRSVETTSSGTAKKVQIALNSPTAQGQVVTMSASDLSYDPASNAVIAQVPRSRIEMMQRSRGAQPPMMPSGPTGAAPRGY